MIPLMTRRSSTLALPRVSLGRCGLSRANCSSLSQKESRSINGLPSETLNHDAPRFGNQFMGPEPRKGEENRAGLYRAGNEGHWHRRTAHQSIEDIAALLGRVADVRHGEHEGADQENRCAATPRRARHPCSW